MKLNSSYKLNIFIHGAAGFECGEPEFPANGGGVVSPKGESYFVDYKCNEGFHLVCDSRRTCHGRHWQGKQPVCSLVALQSSKSITKRYKSLKAKR
jgi:Sushi repeat (SCR repeat)